MAHHWPPTLFSLCFLRFNSLSSWNDVVVLAVVQFQVENCLEHCQHLLDVHTSHSTCSSSSASPRQFTAIKTANYAFCAPRRGSGCCMQQLHFMIAAPCSRSNPLLLHLLPLLIFLLHSFSSPLTSPPAHSLCLPHTRHHTKVLGAARDFELVLLQVRMKSHKACFAHWIIKIYELHARPQQDPLALLAPPAATAVASAAVTVKVVATRIFGSSRNAMKWNYTHTHTYFPGFALCEYYNGATGVRKVWQYILRSFKWNFVVAWE